MRQSGCGRSGFFLFFLFFVNSAWVSWGMQDGKGGNDGDGEHDGEITEDGIGCRD